ncbi:DUF3108 domain-containing protein [Persephonella sp.]|uniref:DUF3108 domain-containing protein n=1 Tax=Persephonella sp. TaxID=2060922 RepID=UPI0025F3286D|nr:DUF3108 domain-containing protein [Persephonella sp.]
MKLLSLFFVLIFLSFSYGETRKDCYTVKYFFITVGNICIHYDFKKTLKVEAKAETTGIFKILKNIRYSGYSISDKNLSPKEFYLKREEKGLIEIHRYKFSKEWINYRKTVIKGADEKIESQKIKNKNYIDPFTASLYYYRQIRSGKPIKKSVFFNGKGYFIPYFKRKIKKLKINNRSYECFYAEINPVKIKVGGIVQPAGVWKLWIEKNKNRLIKGVFKIKAGEVIIEIK